MKNKLTYFSLAVCILCFAISIFPAGAAEYRLMFDNANILTDSEEATLDAKYDEISIRHEMEIVAVAFETIENSTPMDYADDFYDYNGYGYGDSNDGLILIVVMDTSDWWIYTCGKAIKTFTDAGIEYIGEQIVPYLSNGDYYGAFDKFADLCDEFMTQAETGDPFDTHNLPKEPFNILMALIIALAVGFIIAKIYTGSLKNQLNTVTRQNRASDYVKDGSVSITKSTDLFLYRTVNRTAKENPSGRKTSGTHRSLSGRTHGGRGGKF